MNKNNIILFIILAGLSLAYYFLVYKKGSSTLDASEIAFAVKDTSDILAIKMIRRTNDKIQGEVLLKRTHSGWTINDKYPVVPAKINILLQTLKFLEVREPVLEQAKQNMLNLLKQNHTEVEIQMGKSKHKRYYVGTHSQDNKGTFMLLQGADNIYITHLPGFTGYINSRYSTQEDDWRELSLYAVQLEKLEYISVQGKSPELSFKISRSEPGSVWKLDGVEAGEQIQSYMDKLGKIYAESRAEKHYPGKREELQNIPADFIFEIKEFNTAVYRMKIWVRHDRPDFYFALPERDNEELYSLQDFHFGHYLRKSW